MRVRALQTALATLSGFVDAVGFLSVSGSYVAFMSGNSTLLGLAAGGAAADPMLLTAGLLCCFVAGVMAGTLLGGAVRRWRPVSVLLLVVVLLTAAATLDGERQLVAGALVLAGAMGALNTAFNRPGHSGPGLTYMTGTLVRVGQHLADALRGGRWAPVLPDILLWAGVVAGAGLGALAFRAWGIGGLWLAAGVTLVLAGVARLVLPAEPGRA